MAEPRVREPGARQARGHRQVRPGPGHRRPEGDQERAQRRRRRRARRCCSPRVNHAREWIAAEVGRRMPTWWLEHADDPQVAELLGRAELWFLPIQNPDGYDYTFTCGTGFRTANSQMCGATLVTDPADPLRGTYVYKAADGIIRAPNAAQPNTALRMPTNRLWRKTLRDNDGNGIFGDGQDGVDPNRNYPTAWGLDEEGASNTARADLPRAVPALGARGPRVRPAAAPDHARGGHQLPLGRAAAAVPVRLHHGRLLRRRPVVQGHHRHRRRRRGRPVHLAALLGPLHHQRRDDRPRVQQVRVDVVDAGARRVRDGGRRHVLLRRLGLHVPGRREQGRGRLREEPRLRPQRRGDDARPDRPDRPRNATADETQYQVKASPDIEPNRFNVSYGATQTLEATSRRILGAGRLRASRSQRPGRRLAHDHARGEEWKGGERFGDLRGKYYQRVRATIPAEFVQPGTAQTPRPLVAGDVVNVRVIAGSQQQRFSYRVVSTRPAGDRQARARRRGRGLHRPLAEQDAVRRRRRGTSTSTSRRSPATGYTVETYDIDTPPAGPTGTRPPSSSRTSASCSTSTPSCTTRATTWSRRPSARASTPRTTAAAARSARTARSASRAREHLTDVRACATRRCCATT